MVTGKKERKISKFTIFMIALTGMVLCIVASLMLSGEGIRFGNFFASGDICDVPQPLLRESSDTMFYDMEEQRFALGSDTSAKNMVINGDEAKWKYASVTIRTMSCENMDGYLVYYDRTGQELYRQPVVWTAGENMFRMNETIGVYRLGLEFSNAYGGFVSIAGVQMRNGENLIRWNVFLVVFMVSYVAYLMAAILFVTLKSKGKCSLTRKKREDFIKDIYQTGADHIGRCLHGRRLQENRDRVLVLLYFFLFGLMILGGACGWNFAEESYRYLALACLICMSLAAGVCWQKHAGPFVWNKEVLYLWVLFWGMAFLSNLFVTTRSYLSGFQMLLAGGLFFYLWCKMDDPYRMYAYMMKGLELDFVPVLVYCIFCRARITNVTYNGAFQSAEMFAMYCVLMNAVFSVELLHYIRRKDAWLPALGYGAGFGITFYWLLCTESRAGMAAEACVFVLFLVFKRERILNSLRREWKRYLLVILVACMSFGIVKYGVEHIPLVLNTNMVFQNDSMTTSLLSKDLEKIQGLQIPDLQKVVPKEDMELDVVRKNYIWNMNVMGHGTELELYERESLPYNNLLTVMYRYGIFTCIPYIGFLAALLLRVFREIKTKHFKRHGDNIRLLACMTAIIYLCFAFGGNPECDWGHPLWFLFWIGSGILFMERRSSNE